MEGLNFEWTAPTVTLAGRKIILGYGDIACAGSRVLQSMVTANESGVESVEQLGCTGLGKVDLQCTSRSQSTSNSGGVFDAVHFKNETTLIILNAQIRDEICTVLASELVAFLVAQKVASFMVIAATHSNNSSAGPLFMFHNKHFGGLDLVGSDFDPATVIKDAFLAAIVLFAQLEESTAWYVVTVAGYRATGDSGRDGSGESMLALGQAVQQVSGLKFDSAACTALEPTVDTSFSANNLYV
jgi:hypothetical protein